LGRKRRKFADNFKAQVALEALRGDQTIQEIAAKHNLLPTQVSAWKKQAVEGMADAFAKGSSSDERESEIKERHAKIGVRRERHAFE
jgi:transposase-like protein